MTFDNMEMKVSPQDKKRTQLLQKRIHLHDVHNCLVCSLLKVRKEIPTLHKIIVDHEDKI
jgi:hypothetical protein